MTLGGTAQVAAAPQSAAIIDSPMPQQAALRPSPRNVLWQQRTIFSSEYYQILLATHLPTPDGWKADLA